MKNNLLNKKNLLISIAYGLLFTSVCWIISYFNLLNIQSLSLWTGYVVAACNFYVILWAWSRIFLKKRIALAFGVIVIKYALLVIFIYKILQFENFEIISLLVGLFSIMIMVITYSTLQVFKDS